jgi:hypothetical protein
MAGSLAKLDLLDCKPGVWTNPDAETQQTVTAYHHLAFLPNLIGGSASTSLITRISESRS